MGRPNKLMKKRLLFCKNKIMEIINTVDISKKIEIMVEAKASMILLASVIETRFPPSVESQKKTQVDEKHV